MPQDVVGALGNLEQRPQVSVEEIRGLVDHVQLNLPHSQSRQARTVYHFRATY